MTLGCGDYEHEKDCSLKRGPADFWGFVFEV